MSNPIKVILAICIPLLFAAVVPAGAVVIGDWEGSPDSWIDWEDQISIDDPSLMPSKYDYAAVGATSGSQSLKLIDQGWGQTLSIKLDAAQRQAFMENSLFSIDYSVAADTLGVGGFARIQGIVFNVDGLTWSEGGIDLGETENFWFWSGSPERTQTLVYDYSDLKESMNPNPGYVEIILITNGQRDTEPAGPFELYFDNAQLTGPKSYHDLVMEDNPVLYLKFEETPMVDSSANGYWVGQGSGASILPNAGIGNVVHLDGSQNGSVAASVLESPSWGGTYGDEYSFAPDDITFEFWARIEAMTQYGMFFQQIGPYTREDFAPGIGNAGTEENPLGVIRILNGTEDANDMDFWYPPDSNTPADGLWHHYVITYDEQFDADPNLMQIQFYLDGTLKGSTVVGGGAAGLPAKLGPELDHLVIGGENNRGYVYNTLTGLMDEFAIYEGILPGDRVAAHYTRGRLEIEPQNCEQVFERGQGLAADFDRNCIIDLRDFVYVAESWLLCNDPELFGTDPDCGPTW